MSSRNDNEGHEDALRALGRETAVELESIEDARLQAQHRRLLQSVGRGKPRVRLSWQLGLAAAVAGGAAVALIWGLMETPSERIRCIGPAGTVVSEGGWLTSDDTHANRMFRFSEGSELALQRGTRVKLARLGKRDVRVVLAAGRLRSRIRSARRMRWSFLTGPYQTVVVGTRFVLDWNAKARRLELLVTKGRVRVGGGVIAAQGLSVAAGQRLIADSRGATLRDASASAVADASPPSEQQTDAGRALDLPIRKTARPRKTRPALDMSWKPLAQAGRHEEAVVLARRAGWKALVTRLRATDLLLLADSARLSRNAKEAQRALLAARRRFGGQHAGCIAAYRLGRLAADQLRDYRRAARWFRVFLKEAPRSALAGDALGGEMTALQRSGDLAGAKRLARRYLARYPRGAYAASATQLSLQP